MLNDRRVKRITDVKKKLPQHSTLDWTEESNSVKKSSSESESAEPE